MPVITVESLRPPDPTAVDRLMVDLPARFADAIGGDPADTWVYWVPVEAARVGGRFDGWEGHCPVVTVRGRSWRSEEEVRAGLAAAAGAVSAAFALPIEDVWVHWVEVVPGRLFAGGRIR